MASLNLNWKKGIKRIVFVGSIAGALLIGIVAIPKAVSSCSDYSKQKLEFEAWSTKANSNSTNSEINLDADTSNGPWKKYQGKYGELFEKETVISFAQKIKDKYPEYADINDTDLVRRVLKKYPEYLKVIDLPRPTLDEIFSDKNGLPRVKKVALLYEEEIKSKKEECVEAASFGIGLALGFPIVLWGLFYLALFIVNGFTSGKSDEPK